eukprot:jgi/Pico_ML_1/52454/g3156.t1
MSRRSKVDYSKRSEWKDVVPKIQDNGPHGVVAIAYGKTHAELKGYLHAVLDAGEISARAFRLTGDILPYNYACYTVWRLRRKCLFELGMDVQLELDEWEETTLENHKNYQIGWGKQTIDRELKSRVVSTARSFCEKIRAEVPDCRYCIALLADILAEACFDIDSEASLSVARRLDVVGASELYRQLRALDPIRANYWHLRESQVLSVCSGFSPIQAQNGGGVGGTST